MTPDPSADPPAPAASGVGRWHAAWQWGLLLVLSVILAGVLELTGIPAALLMGPMAAGAVVGINGGTIRLPRPALLCGQALIGTMIAETISPGILVTFFGNWPLFLSMVLSVIAMSTLSGYVMSRLNIMPGTTAIWGSSAGAATSMLVMADAYGADVRLVAFMQYLRVVFVAAAASLVARYWAGIDGPGPEIVWFGPVHLVPFLETLGIAIAGGCLGRWLRIPAGVFLLPFLLGSLLSVTGVLVIEIPEWLLAISYAMLGWNIGLGFTRPILAHARRALIPTVVSILVLMGFSGLLAYILVRTVGIDPLTAYLATSPGGMDSIAIIAASSNVDVPFVMALQTARLLLVMAVGPSLARFVASRATPRR
ncbi:ammonia monooxygenase [Pararhizobium polonicum]|uniref:Ammonia monooxygenase n=1 Tax=Pararhizobium polonicum TaxID=1612624 RepID=A0A1C7NY67_9HYPH|nr:AbrB family transcriptional regulator [Pararhizobium polonicum]OBZ93941.1 ammonia monooxygenase [Pararhizobium polonicum]